MTNLTNWISPSTMHSLGWTLLHFLWQGTALSALAAVLMSLCRRASRRYAVGVGTLVLMLAAPVLTFLMVMPSRAAMAREPSSVPHKEARPAGNLLAKLPSAISLSSPSIDYFPPLVEAWLLGVAFFSLRSAGGFLLLERERRKQSSRVSDRVLMLCQALQRKLRLDRTIQYYQCRWSQAPAVIGWFRPIVLLPVTALTGLSEEQLQSIIAHELAHIRNYDAFVNLFQIGVETLLFYHPAVWWLNKRIRAEREHCCDDMAVTLCGNAIEYARALTLMEEWRIAPTLAMAANRGPLTARILRLIDLKSSGDRARRIGLAGGVLCLTAALVSANALLRIAYPTVHASATSLAQISLARFAPAASRQSPSGSTHNSSAAPKPSPASPQAASDSAPSGSYIDGLKSAGLNDFTVDQLIAMKIQGVSPDYVRDLHGLNFMPTADQLVTMRIQGITPDYVRGLKDAGIQPTIDQLIAMKIQDVTPEYVRAMREQGLQSDPEKLIAMRIQDMTPDYVRDVHALGMQPTIEQFISMKIQSVTADYIRGLQAAGFKFSADEVISAKIQQIDEQFIQRAVKHGFQNLTLEKLIQLKNLGVLEPLADI
ncbi:MAG TPA: M56 family metallopeptidase [Candidatus Acidoferrales bacterium]|nr:M56 family metallopeptidase [Candidatus Acidoferrales bacterium]